MLVTVVSHAVIANRIKNIMSEMSQHENVGTLHDTINYILAELEKYMDVDTVTKRERKKKKLKNLI